QKTGGGVIDAGRVCFPLDLATVGGQPRDVYKITRPGVLLLDPTARRKELQSTDPEILADLCSISPISQLSASVPSVQFSSAELIVRTTLQNANGQQLPRYSVDMSFTNLTTSDGYSLPRFEFTFSRPPLPYLTSVVIDPAFDSNTTIPALTQLVEITWNDRTGEIGRPLQWPPSKPLRRLIYAILLGLPELLQRATNTTVESLPPG